MSVRARWITGWVVVGLLFVFAVQFKTSKVFAHPTWDERDEVGQFWSEFAVHYGFAKFFATHPVSDWGQLARDRSLQHPDTLNDWAEFTIAMEVPAGVLYRWFQPAMPFHVWVVWYDCVVSSLSVVALFLLASALWRNQFAGIMASALYVGLYPSYGRTVKYLFLKEDFALPVILFALWATVRMLQQEKQPYREVIAALLWLLALASWHLTQFVLAVGFAAAALVYLGKGETPRRPWFVATLAAGGLLVPVLWEKQFWISPAMCLLYALTFAVWINGGRKRATKVFVAWLVSLLAVSFWLRQSYGEYAHVYQLFLAKLQFFGAKPTDPARLSWEARCLWEGAFETARLGEFWRFLGWTLPLGVIAVWRVEKWRVETRLVAVFALLLVPLAWMVVRYFTFLAPVAAVWAAGVATRGAVWKALVGVAAMWQVSELNYEPLNRAPIVPAHYRPLVEWIGLDNDSVYLASVSESPVIWAHTGRAVVLHSKFENRAVRERYREFLAALYGSEDALHAFARRYGADYFVFDYGCLLTGKDSWRYKADRLGELTAGSPALLMGQPNPATQRFELRFDSPRFRVFWVKP